MSTHSSVRGDFSKLATLKKKLNELASGAFRRRANEATMRAAREAAKAGFRAKRDPYGSPWAKRVGGGRKPLLGGPSRVTGRVTARGFALTFQVPFGAEVHQVGKTIRAKGEDKRGGLFGVGYLRFKIGDRWVQKYKVTIPARPMVPNPARGMGLWRQPLHDSLKELLVQHFARKSGGK